jgi:hypothetical protein
VAPNSVLFLKRMSSLRWRKESGIYSPNRDLVVAASGGRIIRPEVGRIVRPAGLSGLEMKSPANNLARILGDAELGP